MNSMAENYIRYGLDPVESVPVHIYDDVTLWLFQDWSSVVEYRNSGQLIVQENIGGTVPVERVRSAHRLFYSLGGFMADNYVSGSCILRFPAGKAERAIEVAKRVIYAIQEDQDYVIEIEVEFTDEGIWFHEMETFNPDTVAAIASAVIDDLELEDQFVFGWSYSCSKARVDAFGGGSCAIAKGRPPYWIDAYDAARKHFSAEAS